MSLHPAMEARYGHGVYEQYVARLRAVARERRAVLDSLRTRVQAERYCERVRRAIRRGIGAILAAFAGLCHPAVRRVMLKNAPRSFFEMTQTPAIAWPMSSLPWGALNSFDLPDLYRVLAAEKELTMLEPWGPMMTPASETVRHGSVGPLSRASSQALSADEARDEVGLHGAPQRNNNHPRCRCPDPPHPRPLPKTWPAASAAFRAPNFSSRTGTCSDSTARAARC